MHENQLLELLQAVEQGLTTPGQARESIGRILRTETVKGLTLDHARGLRTGLGEVVFGSGKSPDRLVAAMEGLRSRPGEKDETPVLATRLNTDQIDLLHSRFPEGEAWPEAGLFALGGKLGQEPVSQYLPDDQPELAVVMAGASDMPVALEALGSARFFDLNPALVCDVGVAGIHRLSPHLRLLSGTRLLIVCAGMEGALPSVVSGLTGRPVLAVPTSIGYGVSTGGFAALVSMLSSCSPGIAVMNIDNGFGAAAMAKKILTPPA